MMLRRPWIFLKLTHDNARHVDVTLFTFVVLASGAPVTASMAREHYAIVNALRNLDELEFSAEPDYVRIPLDLAHVGTKRRRLAGHLASFQ